MTPSGRTIGADFDAPRTPSTLVHAWRWLLAGAVIFLLAVSIHETDAATPTHQLSCPARSPADWGSPGGALNGVEVLSVPRGEKIDEQSKPSLVPDSSEQRGGTIRQYWRMNGEGPDWEYYVDCDYAGTPRVLRLDARKVKGCERQFDAARPDGGSQSLTCD